MRKSETYSCPDCGTEFGSKWARTEHEKLCAVKQNAEPRRVQEQLEWRRSCLERWIHEGYRSAARAFAAYQNSDYPRLSRLYSGVALLIAQTKELASMVDTLNRKHGARA